VTFARATAFAMMLAALPVIAPAAWAQPVDSAVRQQVLELDARYRRALVERDAGALDALLTDDFQLVHANGAIDDKPGLLRKMHRWQIASYERQVDGVRAYEATVVLTGRSTKTGDGAPQRDVSVEVFVRHNGTWCLASLQNTPVGPPR
jgi:hypothetical protein